MFKYLIVFVLIFKSVLAQNWYWKSGVPNFYSISAIDSNVVWAGGDANFLVRSVNGGQWIWWYQLGGWGLISSVQAIDENSAWVLSTSGDLVLHKIEDQWYDKIIFWLSEDQVPFVNFLHFWDENIGIIVGDPKENNLIPYIIRTVDGGSSWSEITNLPELPAGSYGLIANYSIFESNCWFGIQGGNRTEKYPIYRSTDKGETWDVIMPPEDFGSVHRVSFKDSLYGVIEGSGGIAITTDGGNSWNIKQKPNSLFYTEMNPYNGYLYSNSYVDRIARIARSVDLGDSWEYFDNPSYRYFNDFSFTDSKTIWACGINQSIVLGRGDEPTTGFIKDGEETHNHPNKFELFQNYPNPFNPSTTISYSLRQSGKVTLEIYDIEGAKVKIIEEGFRGSGNYTISFDGRDLASGTYIYRLKVNDKYISKKMVIIK